ncbi:tetratricopeptide repeat protein [Rhodocytophaga rosea]|uniref:Tetratricopeptide repeat protein n=1 Tax=Rhodocytophaga rosea TaxID=2704465 RepID=A0A6C0GT93_9BACT|nr:tetratricopeptide repeat protein [Rhodocytophaga rosea]QHT71379.1 tetratricopeptide repeat protein [Rhodocytophaga rosea]
MYKYLFLLLFTFCSLHLLAQKPEEKAYQKAVGYFNKGKVEKGFKYLEKALAINPAYYDALYARSYYNFGRGNYQQALPDYDTLLVHHPEDTTLYRYRGLARMYTQNYAAAEADLLKALSLDNSDASIYSDLGYFYYQVMDYEQALQYYDKSISRQPSRFAYYQKAQTLYSIDEYEQALVTLEHNLQSDPKDADALRLKALILMNTGKYTETIKIYEQLVANGDIEEPDDFFNWGLTYYLQKKYTQALTYFTTPEKHQDPELFYYIGLSQYKVKNQKAALQALNQAVQFADKTQEETAPYFYNRAIVKADQQDRRGATQDFLQALALTPELFQKLDAEGDTMEVLGNAALLLKSNYSRRQVDSVSAIGYEQRAKKWFEKDGWEKESLALINKSISLDSSRASSRFSRARMYYYGENYMQALNEVNKSISLAAGKPSEDYYHLRGLVYYEMDLPEKAQEDFNKAIAARPEKAAYYYDRAFASASLGEYQESISDINKAIALDSEERNTYLLARVGFYNELNQFDNALADCNELVSSGPDKAVVYYQRGVARMGLKKYDEAIQDFTRAIRLEPDFKEAGEKLTEALQAK